MATTTTTAVFITLSVLAVSSVYSQTVGKSQITQFIEATCTGVYKDALQEEGTNGKCGPDVIEELIDELDSIQNPPANFDEELVEEYLKQASLDSLCYATSNEAIIKSACELMTGVCDYGNNILKCKDAPAATAAPAMPTAAPTMLPPVTT